MQFIDIQGVGQLGFIKSSISIRPHPPSHLKGRIPTSAPAVRLLGGNDVPRAHNQELACTNVILIPFLVLYRFVFLPQTSVSFRVFGGFDGSVLGSHPMVQRFLAGVDRIRPPMRRISPVWDLSVVLD